MIESKGFSQEEADRYGFKMPNTHNCHPRGREEILEKQLELHRTFLRSSSSFCGAFQQTGQGTIRKGIGISGFRVLMLYDHPCLTRFVTLPLVYHLGNNKHRVGIRSA